MVFYSEIGFFSKCRYENRNMEIIQALWQHYGWNLTKKDEKSSRTSISVVSTITRRDASLQICRFSNNWKSWRSSRNRKERKLHDVLKLNLRLRKNSSKHFSSARYVHLTEKRRKIRGTKVRKGYPRFLERSFASSPRR